MQILYSTKLWQCITLANQSFQIFGKENVGEFTIANISYFSESEIWLLRYMVDTTKNSVPV